MTLLTRLFNTAPTTKDATQAVGPGTSEKTTVQQHAHDMAAQRTAKVAALEFGDELLRIATGSNPDQRTAQQRLAQLIDSNGISFEQLASTGDTRLLLCVAALSGVSTHFESLAATVNDQGLWVDLATSGSSSKVRQLAAQHVEGEEGLRAVLKSARDSDKNVYRVAKTKLDQIHAAQKRIEEARAHMLAIAETIERQSYKPFDGAFVATLDHLEAEWRSLTVDVPDETRARVAAALDRGREAIAHHIQAAGAQAARESAIANAEPVRATILTDLQKLLVALFSATAIDDSGTASVTERLVKLRERWRDTLQYKHATNEETAAFERLQGAVQQLAATIRESGTLQQRIDAATADPNDQAYVRIETLLKHASMMSEADVPTVVGAATESVQAWRKQQADKRAHIADAERQLAQLIRRAQQALASGQSRPALGIRKSIDSKISHLKHVPKPLAERLQQLDEKLKEFQDWKSFAVTPKRTELIEQMQALVGIEEEPQQLAEQIKRLQEEWKMLARGSADSDEDWEKFHAAAQAAYEPCRAFFEAQSQQRAQNLAKRQALLARLENYERTTDWEHVEWKHVAAAVRTVKQEWRECGPTDRAASRSLDKTFDKLLGKVQARLDGEYAANLEQKQALVKQAQRLASIEDLAQASDEVKRMQAAWRTIGLTPHAEGQRLWDEFKQLCDAVFDKRRQQHTERVSEQRHTQSQAEALCVEAESLAQLQGVEIYTGTTRIRELREAFNAIGDLPRDTAQSIQRRVRRALDQFDAAVAQQRNRESDDAWVNFFDAANRVGRAQMDNADLEDVRAHVASIKHWPKGGAQAIQRKLSQTSRGDQSANEKTLRTLAIRAEIVSGQPTPEAEQMVRRAMQLQALVDGTGRSTATMREQLDVLAFEWVAVGPTAIASYDELFARFHRAWQASRR